MTASKDVAKAAKAGEVATLDYGEYAGQGFEDQDSSHLSIPFINLLQALSPQVSDDALNVKAGMLFNSVTQDAYDGKKGVVVVPAHIQHCYTEWVPKESGGGFVGVHELASDVVVSARERTNDRNKLKTPNGNDLVETFYMYGALLDEDGETPVGMCVIAFSSTKIKQYRAWNTKRQMFPHRKHGIPNAPPLFAHRVRISSVKQKNAKGEFFNFVLTPAVDGDMRQSLLRPTDEAFQAAFRVRELVNEGKARAAYETSDAGAGETDAEVPF